ncbi:MAG: 50S ribosomal protein L33 [Patescibacteria group bacterium]|nr:50S ribosomal protein L33 [Patescibacteria group bacterium]
MREMITMVCTDCKNKNYHTYKNRKKTQTRLERKKFCNTCRAHTLHREHK